MYIYKIKWLFILFFYLLFFSRTIGVLESLQFFFSASQKGHSWVGEISLSSTEKILRCRSGQATFWNLFGFQMLCTVLSNAKGVAVAGVMKDLESRTCAFLRRKLNRLPRMRRKSLGYFIVSRFFAARLQSVPTNSVRRSHAEWYSVGKCPYATII